MDDSAETEFSGRNKGRSMAFDFLKALRRLDPDC